MNVSGQHHALAALLSGRNFGNHRIGYWAGPGVGLDGSEKREEKYSCRCQVERLFTSLNIQGATLCGRTVYFVRLGLLVYFWCYKNHCGTNW
jgi:hypothetical protein